jgi:hypothetical protein
LWFELGFAIWNTECCCFRISFIPQWLYSPLLGPGLFFSFVIFFYTDSRTPWTRDQPIARPLPTHRTTQTQNKRTHRHPCLEWVSVPQSQRSSGQRQFTAIGFLRTSVSIIAPATAAWVRIGWGETE